MRNLTENAVADKSLAFALRVIALYKYLCAEKNEYVLSKQVLRSGTSIGANIAEAQCAVSRKDFLSKLYIAFKECSETIGWSCCSGRTILMLRNITLFSPIARSF